MKLNPALNNHYRFKQQNAEKKPNLNYYNFFSAVFLHCSTAQARLPAAVRGFASRREAEACPKQVRVRLGPCAKGAVPRVCVLRTNTVLVAVY